MKPDHRQAPDQIPDARVDPGEIGHVIPLEEHGRHVPVPQPRERVPVQQVRVAQLDAERDLAVHLGDERVQAVAQVRRPGQVLTVEVTKLKHEDADPTPDRLQAFHHLRKEFG